LFSVFGIIIVIIIITLFSFTIDKNS
jgi:hypothetical protein